MGRKKYIIVYEERICKECGSKFNVDKRNRKQFCTSTCAKRNNGKNNKGRTHSKEINKQKGLAGKLNAFYGRTHSEESKKKISNANTGRKFSNEVNKSKGRIGEENAFYGKTHSEESRAKISESHRDCKGENNPMYGQGDKVRGEKNGSWNGGISFGDYGPEFNEELKTLIRKRDHFKCVVCGKNGYVVHHIDYDKKNNLEENLITLCISDHAKTNFNRESWIEFFNKYKLNEYGKNNR